jgi:lipopolysaccharide export system permease protein
MSSRDVFAAMEEKRNALAERRREHRRNTARQAAALYNRYVYLQEQVASGAVAAEAGFSGLVDQRSLVVRERRRPITDRTLQIFSIEFHKKFSIPFGCFAFAVLAFPLGRFAKRSGRSVGFGLGLFVAIVYWSLLVGGQTIGVQNQTTSPALMMWLPNIVVVVAGMAMLSLRRWVLK